MAVCNKSKLHSARNTSTLPSDRRYVKRNNRALSFDIAQWKGLCLDLKRLRVSTKPVSSSQVSKPNASRLSSFEYFSLAGRDWLLARFFSSRLYAQRIPFPARLNATIFTHIQREEWIFSNKNCFNLQPIIISKSRLNKFFNLSELPSEIGGSQSYNHDEWLRNRVVSVDASLTVLVGEELSFSCFAATWRLQETLRHDYDIN